MTKKTKQLIIAVIAVFVVGIATWAVINYQAKHKKIEQYNMALAEQFDKTMAVAYPLLENYALSLSDKADSLEVMRKKALEMDKDQYNLVFYTLWDTYTHTEKARTAFALTEEFEYFSSSPVFTLLMNSGEKREKEISGIQKLTWAGNLLRDPVLLKNDSLMNATKLARQFISDGIEVIKPYHNENTNIHAWRDIR